MKITNKLNLPQPFVSAVGRDYEIRDNALSATTLLKGTKQIVLERRHANSIEQDVADMIWLIFGTAVHNILEAAQETESQIKEERLYRKVNDIEIGGQFDLYDDKQKKVIDYKTCSVWKIIYQDFEDWKQQLLIYAWLLKDCGFEVTSGQVVAVMKDHSKTKAKNDAQYPEFPVKLIDFEFTESDFAQIEIFIQTKVEDYKRALTLNDDDIAICSEKERWYTGTKYAIMKGSNKRATKLHDTKVAAEAHLLELGKGYSIVKRDGESKRCLEYCSVKEYCHYGRGLNNE